MLGDRWSLLIARDLVFRGFREFGQFLGADEGISTNILTERLERLLATGSPPEIRILCRSMLHLVNSEAVLRYFKPLTRLPADKAAAYLDRHWVHGLIFNRLAFRLFAVMLKGSYFDDARVYAALGIEYDRPPVVEERPRWMGQVTRGADR